MKTTNLFAIVVTISCLEFNAAAQTWTQANVTNAFRYAEYFVTMSADGCKLAATTSTAHPVFSTDAGKIWQTNQSPSDGYVDIASSADGTKLVTPFAVSNVNLYVSTNSGSNWMVTTAPPAGYRGLSSSALGNVLAAASYNGFMYVSTNSGLTWATNTQVIQNWISVASSADGTKLAAAAYNNKIYVSTNFGTTWTATQSATDSWFSVACSADGTKLIASGSATYVSTNFGTYWMLANTNAGYVASSADGTKLILAGPFYTLTSSPNRSIYTSGDSGVTWVSNNAPAVGWLSVAASADGSEFVGGPSGGGIWIGRTTPSPQLNVEPAGSNLTLSWLVPSTNFILQQNSDLTAANWAAVTNTPTLNLTNLQNQVTLPASATSAFFRLTTQ
jgi:hypothetical protein